MNVSDSTIWIVIPVYNVEKYLKKCIKSVQKQTYTDWKMILVDDGSPDSSGRICDKFAGKDSRIQVLHTENGGLAVARRRGLEKVEGSYCCFLDSDDTLPEKALETLYNEAQKTRAEIVCGRWQRMLRGIKLEVGVKLSCFNNPKCYSHEEIMSDLYISCFGITDFPVSLCAKLFKSEKLKNIMLDGSEIPKYFAEDMDVTMRLLPTVESLSIIDDVVYNYRIGGGTSKFMPTFLDDSLMIYERKKIYSGFYTGKRDLNQLTVIDLKNVIMTYLTMCERFSRFSKGSLKAEFEYLLSLPQVKEIVPHLGNNTDEKALAKNDFSTIEAIVKERVSAIKRREKIKKLLLGK